MYVCLCRVFSYRMAEGTSDPDFIDISTDALLNELTQEEDTSEVNKEEAESNDTTTTSSERIKCPECPRYTTTTQDKLLRHIRKAHRGENPFQCFMCDYSTYNKSLFEEHVRIHKGIKPFKCAHCPHRNVSKKNLKKHEKIHRPDNPLKCPHCDHIARHRRGFDYHAKRYHPLKVEKEQCHLCNKTFDNDKLLTLHISKLKKCNEMTDSEICGYSACSSALIKVHKAVEHGIVVDRRCKKELFSCSLCAWSSGNKTRILLHLIHHPEQSVDESVIDVSILRKHGIMA